MNQATFAWSFRQPKEVQSQGRNLAVIYAYQILAKLATKKFLQKSSVFVVAFKTSDERSPCIENPLAPWH